ncbi:hypothetical protein [Corallococcus sp. 4LFB]|uniref:hypothetical protein n=1 Tax=Corallococcus sp. 4LFB TaxID=3383249 RepID=UPI00397485A6
MEAFIRAHPQVGLGALQGHGLGLVFARLRQPLVEVLDDARVLVLALQSMQDVVRPGHQVVGHRHGLLFEGGLVVAQQAFEGLDAGDALPLELLGEVLLHRAGVGHVALLGVVVIRRGRLAQLRLVVLERHVEGGGPLDPLRSAIERLHALEPLRAVGPVGLDGLVQDAGRVGAGAGPGRSVVGAR